MLYCDIIVFLGCLLYLKIGYIILLIMEDVMDMLMLDVVILNKKVEIVRCFLVFLFVDVVIYDFVEICVYECDVFMVYWCLFFCVVLLVNIEEVSEVFKICYEMDVLVVLCGLGILLVGGVLLMVDSVIFGVVKMVDVLEVNYFD